MNVTLNTVSAGAGAERAGMGASRGEAEAGSGDFRALFDQVGRASVDEHGLQSDRHPAQKSGDGERMTRDGPAEAVPDEPDSNAPDNPVAARLQSEDGDAVAPPQADMDGAGDPVTCRQSGQTNRRKDGKALPADASAASVSDAAAAAVPAGATLPAAVGTPGPQVPAKDAATDAVTSGDARPTDRKSDGRLSAPDSNIADTLWRFASGDIREPIKNDANAISRAAPPRGGMAPADDAGRAGETGLDTSAEPSSRPAAAKAEAGSGQIRIWTDGETAAAFASRADDSRPLRANTPTDTLQAAQRTPSSGGADAPIDARVTAYERHPAAPGAPSRRSDAPIDGLAVSREDHQAAATPAGGGQIAAAADDRLGRDGGPKAESAAQVGTGSVEKSQAARRNQSWQPLFSPDRGESSASTTAPSDQRMSVKADGGAVPDAMMRSEPDAAGGRESRKTNPAIVRASGHADEKRQAAIVQSSPANNPPAGASTPGAAPASPLTAGVASSIANALASARTASAAPSASVHLDPATGAGAAEPVKSIALALDMREHGQVDLRISLRGNAVSVRVRTERAETADALARDDASLRAVLHRAGYETQQIQIDRRDGAAARTGDAAPSGQPAVGTGASGFSGQTEGDQRAATPDQRPQARRDETALSIQDQDTHDVPRQDRYRGPDRLYV